MSPPWFVHTDELVRVSSGQVRTCPGSGLSEPDHSTPSRTCVFCASRGRNPNRTSALTTLIGRMTVLGSLIETTDAKRTRLRYNAKNSSLDPQPEDGTQAGAAHYELPTPSGTLFIDMADAALMMHLTARSSSAESLGGQASHGRPRSSTRDGPRDCRSSSSAENLVPGSRRRSISGAIANRRRSLLSGSSSSGGGSRNLLGLGLVAALRAQLSRTEHELSGRGTSSSGAGSKRVTKGTLADLLASGDHERLQAMGEAETAEVRRRPRNPHTPSLPLDASSRAPSPALCARRPRRARRRSPRCSRSGSRRNCRCSRCGGR